MALPIAGATLVFLLGLALGATAVRAQPAPGDSPAAPAPLPRRWVTFAAGYRLAPWTPRGAIAQGLVVTVETAVRLQHGARVYVRGTVTGVDRAISIGLRGNPVKLDTRLGIHRDLGRFFIEAEVGPTQVMRER